MAGKPLISPSTMRSLRAIDERAMPDIATLIQPGDRVPDGRGNTTPGTPVTRPLAGRFSHGSGDGVGQQGMAEDDREELVRRGATARMRIATTEDVTEDDELVYGGQHYNIVYAPTPTAYSSSRLIGLKLIGPAV